MKDIQGMERGKCNVPGCECEEYRTSSPGSERRGGGKILCEYCDHTPVQHVKIIELGECKACGKDNCSKYEFDDPHSYSNCAYCGCPANQHAGADKLRKPQPQQAAFLITCQPLEQPLSMVPVPALWAAASLGGIQPRTNAYEQPTCGGISGAKKKQKTATVLIRKTAKQPLGLILSKQHCDLNERGDIGFMIVGVVTGSPVFNLLQSDQIRLLDVIESVNDTPCRDILSRDVDLQVCFERYIEDKQSVKLTLNHSMSLPLISGSLSCAKKKSVDYKHVVVLLHSPESVGEHFGLTLGVNVNKVVVKGVTKDSPADLSRVKFDDKICMYVVGSQEGLSPSQIVNKTGLTAIKKDLENAQASGWNVILFVQRGISYI